MSGLIALFFAGALLVNGVPHFVNGVSGRRFPTPFATPPGRGESTARTNVLWGALNFAAGYGLGWRFAQFDATQTAQIAALVAGGLLMALAIGEYFGRRYGGDRAEPKS
ncbi:MAG TPA: hypothetical protein VFM56_15070 [Solimonas sp.]|nr:hypothetical protein [Solimonas sp.]